MKGYITNLDVAEEFYIRCSEQGAVTREEKEAVMEALVKELKAVRLNDADLKRYLSSKRSALYIKNGAPSNDKKKCS